MIRWYIKADGEKVLQESCGGGKVGPYEWRDVPTKVERGREPVKCMHVLDGLVYTSYPPKYRCVKCGEYFYKTPEMEKNHD